MTGNNIDLGSGTDTIKFTTATNADTVTVTNTTISGAKTRFTKTASNIGITTGAGSDLRSLGHTRSGRFHLHKFWQRLHPVPQER